MKKLIKPATGVEWAENWGFEKDIKYLLDVMRFCLLYAKRSREKGVNYITLIAGVKMLCAIGRLNMVRKDPAILRKGPKIFSVLFRLIASGKRARMFDRIYCVLRYIDDVVDGDFQMSGEMADEWLEVLQQQVKQEVFADSTLVDRWFQDILVDSNDLGCKDELLQLFGDMIGSLRFDLQRRRAFEETDKAVVYDDAVLFHYKSERNCIPTGKAMLEVVGIDSSRMERECPEVKEKFCLIAYATDSYYAIRDLEEDVKAGRVNIGKQTMQRHGIRLEMLQEFVSDGVDWGSAPAPLKHWAKEEIQKLYRDMREFYEFMQGFLVRYASKYPEYDFEAVECILMEVYYPPLRKFMTQMARALTLEHLEHEYSEKKFQRQVRTYAAAYIEQYAPEFDFAPEEYQRFESKVINQAMLYTGYVPVRTKDAAQKAALSSLCCVVYDVASDWGRDVAVERGRFVRIMRAEQISGDCIVSALDLFDRDVSGKLSEHDYALERGSIAFEFITKLIGSWEYYSLICDPDEEGRAWQIMDDLGDIEQDKKDGEYNAFLMIQHPREKDALIKRALQLTDQFDMDDRLCSFQLKCKIPVQRLQDMLH